MSEKVGLKPCPFCGGKAAIGTLFHSCDNMVKYTIKCSGCGVLTPLLKTKKKARKAWNRRKDDDD